MESGTIQANAAPARDRDVVARAWTDLEDLTDPEIPVLTLMDLGIIRWIRADGESITVGIAPTYTACPATEVIEASVLQRLEDRGYAPATVKRVLSPPWTTDWISDEGRRKLTAYGITPPAETSQSKKALLGAKPAIACPRCAGTETTMVSEFGSTPCKAAYKCDRCLEPFDYFKCL